MILRVTALLLLTGCAGQYSLGGGPMVTTGDVGGSQNSGTGGGIEVAYLAPLGNAALGGLLSGNIGGYDATGDSDVLLWAELTGLYRRFFPDSARRVTPFLSGGVGVGAERYSGVVTSLFVEAGLQWRPAHSFGFSLGLRERPAIFISGGGAARFNNTIQLGITADVFMGSQ